MIKKITLLIILSLLTLSCGKKADPVYKESKENNNTRIISVI